MFSCSRHSDWQGVYLWTHKELVYKGTELHQDGWQTFDLRATDIMNVGCAISDGQGAGDFIRFWAGVCEIFCVPMRTQTHTDGMRTRQHNKYKLEW